MTRGRACRLSQKHSRKRTHALPVPCNCRFAPQDHLVEVDGPLVDHSTILSHPLGLKGLSSILKRMGVPNTNPVKAFFTGR